MKTSIVLSAIALVFCFSAASAKDLKFPKKGDPLFSISIPDDWNPKFDDEGTLEAQHPDELSYIAVWEEDSNVELAKVAEDVDDVLNEYAKDVKVEGKPVPYNNLGVPGLIIKGTAKDKEDGEAIGFEVIILAVDKDSAAVIYFDYPADAPEVVAKNLVKILESIKSAK